jgi:CRP-like cAMP-binding protein
VTAYLVHVGYVLMLAAFVARDMLWLRATLVCAQSILGVYAWSIRVPAIAAWNVLFVAINLVWVVKIVRERRAVVLPPALARLYERHFSALTPAEFKRWWAQGRHERLQDARLTRNGTQPEALYFLLSGTARVSRDGEPVVDLEAGQFVAEMSLITGRPANADVWIAGEAELVSWPVTDLRGIQERQPVLWGRLQSVIGHDLVEKIRRSERR